MRCDARAIASVVGLCLAVVAVVLGRPVPVKRCKGCCKKCKDPWYLPLDYSTVPPAIVIILIAGTCINGTVFLRGLLGPVAPDWAVDETSTSSLIPVTIVVLVMCLAYACLSADASGLFRHLAMLIAERATKAKRPWLVGLWLFFALATVFTLVTSNDVVILTLTPVIIAFVHRLGQGENSDTLLQPLMLCEFATANSLSVCLLIGNPSNMILTSVFGISFSDYAEALVLPGIIAGLTSVLGPLVWCVARGKKSENSNKDKDKKNDEKSGVEVALDSEIRNEDEKEGKTTTTSQSEKEENNIVNSGEVKEDVENEKDMKFDSNQIVSIVFILMMFLLFVLSTPIQKALPEFQLCYIAIFTFVLFLIKDIVLQVKYKKVSIWKIVKSMPWTLPLFLLAMFILVEEIVYIGLIDDIARLLAKGIITPTLNMLGDSIAAGFLLDLFFIVATCILCCLFNNLPATIIMSRIVSSSSIAQCFDSNSTTLQSIAYSVAAGTNYGACLLRHCSLAGLMWNGLVVGKVGKILGPVWRRGALLTVILSVVCVCMITIERLIWL